MPKQNIVTAILLHLLSGGIYGFYWFYSRSKLLISEKPDAHKYVNAALGLLLLLLMSVVLLGFLPNQHGFWYLSQILQTFGLPIVVGIYVFMGLAAIEICEHISEISSKCNKLLLIALTFFGLISFVYLVQIINARSEQLNN